MEFFRNTSIDFLGKKWYFLGFSLIFSVAGLLSMFFWHGVPLGLDFRGGTNVFVKFADKPNENAIRAALDKAGLHSARIQTFGQGSNEVLIGLDVKETSEADLDRGKNQIIQALQSVAPQGKLDLSNVRADVVGPQVGSQLQKQATLAVAFSLLGMLTNQEITLTVIAAILTLVGYSMNDTIVVFDRIRENIKLMRRESLSEIVNRSINQTLSRTILTSGLTFLTVLSLYLFGGEVLRGFSFALVIGIIIGTYSSIAVAAPMLVAYQDWRLSRSGRRVPVRAKA